MKIIQIQVPEEVNEYHLKMVVAGSLFERGLLSSGQAAELVGVSKRNFIEPIGAYGFFLFDDIMLEVNSTPQ